MYTLSFDEIKQALSLIAREVLEECSHFFCDSYIEYKEGYREYIGALREELLAYAKRFNYPMHLAKQVIGEWSCYKKIEEELDKIGEKRRALMHEPFPSKEFVWD